MQTFAAHVARLPADDREAVLADVPGAIRSSIESAGLLGWLPLEANVLCTRAVGKRLGPERADLFFRQLLLGAADGPLLRGLVQSVIRVAVRDPGLYLPWVPKGWALMFRDTGQMSIVERSKGAAVVSIEGLVDECLREPVWIQSVASALGALADLVTLDGGATVSSVSPATQVVTYRLRWTPR
jgi:hypothetical protein